ncbi:GGDEF domain-containing protein [Pseudidiomarina sp. 1ASP75-14]|uniref:GGDEF domain-containing protein n=1 Tax=Pseudidiomarina terrestris TaxID=2820060 RepID=UPI002656BC29|nr:GGDEF domain-containing protein [Pseudidiomarina sp. 1ASP75-14]MDN7137185.1 GGDEF domain-containing protein [Pseudidiomarina sp. 1ASP75-14]
MPFHLPTLIITVISLNLMLGGLMLVIYEVRKTQKCFFTWGISCFIFGIAVGLAGMQTYFDQAWLTIFVADVLIILTPLLLLHGLRQFQMQRPVSYKLVALVLSYSALPLVLLYTAPIHAQTFTAVVCAAIFLYAAIYILTIQQAPTLMRWMLFLLFLAHGALMLTQSGMLVQNLALKNVLMLPSSFEWLLIGHLALTTGTATLFPLLAFAMSEKRLLEVTNFDELTHMLNRRGFLERTGLLLAKNRIQRRPFCVLVVNLDQFKNINANYGDATGEECLRQVADIIQGHLREHDVAARIGGEKFAVALADVDRNQAELISYRLCDRIGKATLSIQGEILKLTASIGGIHSRSSRCELGDLLRTADEALYRAKSTGHNRFVLATQA